MQTNYLVTVSAPVALSRHITEAINKLSKVHLQHIRAYDPHRGKDNERRLTGQHETANIKDFFHGVAHRGATIRIPRQVAEDDMGYMEDRRPSSNCDPYQVNQSINRAINQSINQPFVWHIA